jgi:hypothetical protein
VLNDATVRDSHREVWHVLPGLADHGLEQVHTASHSGRGVLVLHRRVSGELVCDRQISSAEPALDDLPQRLLVIRHADS